jgi:hypothetical protein
MTRELADLVAPGGRVIGVEPNPALRTIAEQRARESGSPATFIEEALRLYTSAAEAGYAFSAVTVFGFLARKPGAPDSVGA